jgi:lysophospholipase L1-like esterase
MRPSPPVSRFARPVVAACLALALAACSSGPRVVGGAAVPAVSPPGAPMTYVAIGASETAGIGVADPVRDGWAYRFYRRALPRAAVFVNLAIPGATTADALHRELPEAERLHPDVVTVWLSVNDLEAGVPPSTYQEEMANVLRLLRGSRVFVANTPPLSGLPRFSGVPGVDALAAAYDDALSRAVAGTGATIVDLRPFARQADRGGTAGRYISDDGLHPNAAGYAAIARVFERAFTASV